jgi:cyclopropane fatty-acyl-phospholipid synthase-like methyltransferase
MTNSEPFTPAAGRFAPTALYDGGVRLLTRETVWRGELVHRLSPAPGEAILDVGCGTGSLAILLKQAQPEASITGLDPDSEALAIARAKADVAGVEIEWRQGFAHDAADFGAFDKVVSSLVFHQVPLEGKRSGIAAMFRAVKPDGLVCIADYAAQRLWRMRQAFRFIQMIDGRPNTQLNADGFIETELSGILGKTVVPAYAIHTPTGTISIFSEPKAKTPEKSGDVS